MTIQPDQPFAPTHNVPAGGMATWAAPGAPTDGPRLEPGLPVQVQQTHGDWAQIVCSNGWGAWVDGRILVPAQSFGPPTLPVSAAVVATAIAPEATTAAIPVTELPATPTTPAAGVAVQPRQIPPLAAPAPSASSSFTVPGAQTWPSIVGLLAVAVAVFLPWIDVGGGADTFNAFDIPLSFTWDKKSVFDDGVALGSALLVIAGASFLLIHFTKVRQLGRVVGGLAVVVTLLYMFQLNSLAGDGRPSQSLFDVAGIGVWPALVGSGLLAWGAMPDKA